MYIIEHIVVPNLCILCSVLALQLEKCYVRAELLRYCRNVRPTWVKFDSKDTKESE